MDDQFINNKITLSDIAKVLGTSKSTVSRALAHNSRISKEMTQKVLNYCNEIGYQPNPIAKALSNAKSNNIGVVIPSRYDFESMSFFHQCLTEIAQYSSNHGYEVFVSNESIKSNDSLSRLVKTGKVDGIILTRIYDNDPRIDFLVESEIPFVVIGKSSRNNVHQIVTNTAIACAEFTKQLLVNISSFSEIILLSGDSSITENRERVDGFIKAINKLNYKNIKYKIIENLNDANSLANELDKEQLNTKTLIICTDDCICTYLITWIRNKNLRIPQDIEIASFYDSVLLQQNDPPITSIEFDPKAAGKKAVEILFKLLDNSSDVDKSVTIDYKFNFRASTN